MQQYTNSFDRILLVFSIKNLSIKIWFFKSSFKMNVSEIIFKFVNNFSKTYICFSNSLILQGIIG